MEATPRYRPSWFVRLFHSRPHRDISFRVVNDTFNLQDELYLESLGIWASAPAAVLILSLIILLFYLLAYCCKRRRAKKHKFGFLRWVLVFFAVLCCGALACAMYGNEAAHSSIVDFVRHVESIDRRASGAKNQTSDVADKLHKDVDPRLSLLRDEFNKREEYGDPRIKMALDDMSKNMTEAKTMIASISARISHVDYSYFATFVTQVESIRWPVTMAVMGLFVLFCLVLLLGIAKRSRCTLMTFSVLGLIATVFTGLLVCAVFVVAMGLSDICWAPDKFVLDHIGTYPPRPIAEFYVMCNPLADNPFEDFVSNSLRATTSIQTSLKLVTDVAEKHDEDKMRQNQQLHANLGKLGQALNATSQSIVKLNEALHCRPVHSDYIHALESGCNRLMYGLTWTLLSVAGACILFYLLVLLDSHLWIYMRKRIYATTEEADPFLPQGQRSGGSQAGSLGRRTNIPMTGSLGPNYRARHFSNTHTPPQTPPFPGTLNGRMNVETDPRYNTYGHNYQPQPHYGYAQGHHHPGAPPVSIATLPGPNHGQYATLSRHCKTLESSSFY